MVGWKAWVLLSGFIILLCAPGAALAETAEVVVQSSASGMVKVQAPSGGITVEYVNHRSSWAPLAFLSRAVGIGPRDSGVINMRPESDGLSLPFRWSLFADEKQGVLLQGSLVLKELHQTTPVSGPALMLGGDLPQHFELMMAPTSDWIRPGIYKGDLLLGQEEKPIAVTVQVRDPAGVAVAVTLFGLGVNLLLNLFRKQHGQLAEIVRLNRMAQYVDPDTPKLMTKLLGWANLDLLKGTADGKAMAAKHLTCADMVLPLAGKPYEDWVTQLDALKDHAYYWLQIKERIEKTDASRLNRLTFHKAIHATVQDVLPGYPAPAAELKGNDECARKGSFKRLRTWLGLGGATLITIRIIQAGILVAAIDATVLAAVAFYRQAPAFGSDILASYGGVFLIGYVGKEFNDLLQKVAPNVFSGIVINPVAGATDSAGQD